VAVYGWNVAVFQVLATTYLSSRLPLSSTLTFLTTALFFHPSSGIRLWQNAILNHLQTHPHLTLVVTNKH
jgi:hypothetical protein